MKSVMLGAPLLLTVATVSVAADWPDFLTTGRLLNIGLNYSSLAPERLDAFAAMGCRMMLGGASWVPGWGAPSEGCLQPYLERGWRAIAYTTPHTIYGDGFFEGHDPAEAGPRDRDWLAVGPDGQPLRPWGTEGQRYLACVNNPGWRAYCRNIMERFVRIQASGVFWDDAFAFGCVCRHCQAAFRRYLAERYSPQELAAMGVTETELPPPPARSFPDLRDCKTALDREWGTFAQWSLENFMAEMKAHARTLDPEFIFSVNSSQPGVTSCMLLSQNVMDLWVYEEGPRSLAPGHNNALRYWQGFARAARKPVEMIGGGEGWGQEGATPTQYAASIAEAVACGGEFLLHLGHAGQDDEVWRTNPENARTIARYRRFFNDRQDLLVGLRPAARVAIFDSNKSAWFYGDYFPWLAHLAGNLSWSGIPYTVINAEATPELAHEFGVLILNWARVLSDREIAILRQFQEHGGKLIVIHDAGGYDERWQPRVGAPLGEPTFPEMPSAEELAAVLSPHANLAPRLSIPGGARVQLQPWEKTDATGRVLVLHVLNYTTDTSGQGITPVEGIRLRLPPGVDPTRMVWETPQGEVQNLTGRSVEGGTVVDLPTLEVYGLVTVRCG